MKKSFTFTLAVVLSFAFGMTASAADENTGKNGSARSGLSMISGNISKIDTTDPSKIKIEVNGERDNQLHIIEVAPFTSVTKVTDISELKAGDAVRVMARKADDREVAMGIMFGNLKRLPAAVKEAPKK